MLANSKQTSFTVKDVPAANFIKSYAEQLKTHNRAQLPQVLYFRYIRIFSGLTTSRLELLENWPLKTLTGFSPESV